MKWYLIVSSLLGLVIVIVSACAPTSTESITTTSTPTQQLATTAPPTATKPLITQTSEIIPVTGPPMEIGSVYPYADGSNLVAVPAGEFIMGGNEAENPEHVVSLSDYWIYSTEVTNQQYALCVGKGNCTPPDLDDNPAYTDSANANDPVVGVTYDQAVAYCEFVNGRLPTEAEWEKAARGPKGNIYPWGDETPSCDLGNFDNCVGEKTNVIDYPDGKSYYGSLDMAGNAFEWVADWYDAGYYNNSPKENPSGPEDGTARSVRSSSFESNADQMAIVVRNAEDPQNHRTDLGFRCVVNAPTYFAPFCQTAVVYGADASTGASGQSSGSETCPSVDVSQAKYCSGKIAATNITFSGPPDAVIDSGDCLPSGDPALFVCQSASQVSITANCELDLPDNLTCPAGYSQQGDTCVADGGSGQCLDGWNFDSANQCCMAQPGQDSPSNISICPVGTYYLAGQNACLPFPAQGIVSVFQDVQLKACGAFGRGDDSSGGSGDSVGGDSGGGGSCDPLCY
jgi:formylglycine-generating enzyme required for sulfatase activity